MNNNLTFGLTFFNVINLLFGILFGFILMAMIASAILAHVLSKYNKDDKIREISKRAYNDFYLKQEHMKDKIISSLVYEINEVSSQCYPDKKFPLYELSINEILGGIMILHGKLNKFINHPLCNNLKNVHVSTILSIEENIAKPVMTIYNKKIVRFLYKSYKIFRTITNFVNPIFYIKKIMSKTIFKKGKKDIVLICLDFIGNCTYEIYTIEKSQNINSIDLQT